MNYSDQRWLAVPRESASDALWVTYRWMTLGLATRGLVALLIAHSPDALDFLLGNRILFYALLFGQLGLVLAFGAVAARASTTVTALMFFAYAALTGVTFSILFLVYTAASIAGTFFVTAGGVAGLLGLCSASQRGLSAVGGFGPLRPRGPLP